MHHLPLVNLAAGPPGGPGPTPVPAHQLYLLGGIILGAVLFLVILLVITSMRRNSMRRLGRPPARPEPHPLHKQEIDPWQESARRLETDPTED